MVTDAEGNLGTALHLRDEASKGASGRVIPLNKELRAALQKLKDGHRTSPYVITTERSQPPFLPRPATLLATTPSSCCPSKQGYEQRRLQS
jgi:hypothetical protein